MGGIGSGRPADLGRDTVESCRAIDVNRLHQEGCLHHGWWGGWQWTRDGEKVASINLRAEEDRLHLSYRVRIAGGDWEDVEETRPHRPRPLPVWRHAVLFHLSRCRERNPLRAARRQASWAGTVFPVPELLSPSAHQPERGRMGSSIKASQHDPHAPRRRTRHGSAVPAPSQGHVAADLRTPLRGSLRGRTVCRRRVPHQRRKAVDPDR